MYNSYNRATVRRSYYQKRRRMRLFTILILLVLIVVMIFVLAKCRNQDSAGLDESVSSAGFLSSEPSAATSEESSGSLASSETSSQGKTSSTAASEKASSVKSSSSATQSSLNVSAELASWYLRLVNKSNPLPSSFVPNVTAIDQKYCRDAGFKYDSRAVSYLNEMCAAARADGVNLLVISPYRSIAKQQSLFDAEVAEHKGLSSKEAEAAAAMVVARPGTSEHNLGLAVDFNSLETSFDQTSTYRWLAKNAVNYGFIMRYPKDKVSITGVSYEPWHYRYVGAFHAAQINEKKMCLEEYIDYLRSREK